MHSHISQRYHKIWYFWLLNEIIASQKNQTQYSLWWNHQKLLLSSIVFFSFENSTRKLKKTFENFHSESLFPS